MIINDKTYQIQFGIFTSTRRGEQVPGAFNVHRSKPHNDFWRQVENTDFNLSV